MKVIQTTHLIAIPDNGTKYTQNPLPNLPVSPF